MNFNHLSLQAIAEQLSGAIIDGDSQVLIHGVASLDTADKGQLAFLANPRYAPLLETTAASAVIVSPDTPRPASGVTLLRIKAPYLAFARALTLLCAPQNPQPGVHPGAYVHESASLGAGTTVMPGAYVGAGATVGAESMLYPGVVVMDRCKIGANCLLYPGVVLREDCVLGDRVILQPNATIGGDGYGFAQDGAKHVKIPQVSNVIIEDDVEIGAGTCVDRGALGPTRIARGTKIDDLVMIGHGAQVGEDGLIVAQSGIAGSATLGDRVVLGARAGVLGHLTVADESILYSRSHLTKSLPPKSLVSGNPARPHKEQLRQEALLKQLDKLVKRVASLEKALEDNQAKKR